jgi:glycosyltransferase involved in cell wall biosynthesis
MLTLERAVASVVRQTALPQELILVDDCSGDETRSLMIQLQSRYNPGWIRIVLLEVNVGAASSRNVGWDQANGKFVAFLDADDAWHPRKIELQYKFMAAATDIVISGHGHIQVDALQDAKKVGEAKFQRVSPLYVLVKNPFVTPSFMIQRDFEFRFLAGRRHMEDHYFLMQASFAGFGIARSSVSLAYIFKPIFGESGLSADLLQMQRSELENYRLIGRTYKISPFVVVLLEAYSWLKFCRRYAIVWVRSIYKMK